MTIDNDIQSLLAIERHLHQSKSDTSILLDALAELVRAAITPTTLTIGKTWGGDEWMFNTPNSPYGNLASNVAIKNGHLTIRPPAGQNWRDTIHYELANPDFPDNLIQDIKNWLP